MPKLTIDGQTYEAEKGKTVIQVADDLGVEIPRYCYHPDIGIEASCRMCLVEVKGAPKLMPACATPIAEGMKIRTNTERVREAVRYAKRRSSIKRPNSLPHPLSYSRASSGGLVRIHDSKKRLAGTNAG